MRTFALVLWLVWPVFAQDVVSPETMGMSAERLARIDSIYEKAVAAKQIAGAVTLVARHGKIVQFKAYGEMGLDSGKPMMTDTIFRQASMTKLVTAVAAMMLYEEGHFVLSDPVSRFIPLFGKLKVMEPCAEEDTDCVDTKLVDPKRPMTVKHLLTHTSGITYGFMGGKLGKMYEDADIYDGLSPAKGTIGEMVTRMAELPLKWHPGERYEYGLSLDVLGYLVEIWSGQTLAEFMQSRIFEPLKMKDTYFFLPESKWSRLASVYTLDEKGGLLKMGTEGARRFGVIMSGNFPMNPDGSYFAGGAGLCSTALDYFRFVQMLMGGGELEGKRLLSPVTVRLMGQNFLGEGGIPGMPGATHGLGIGVVTNPAAYEQMWSEGTWVWGGIFGTRSTFDRETGLVAISLTQLWPYRQLKLWEHFEALANTAITEL